MTDADLTDHGGDGTRAQHTGGDCAQLPAGLIAAYVGGALNPTAAWSVEAHLPGCAACRATLAGGGQADRLAANRSVLLARLALPPPSPAARVLRRCGIGEHVLSLLAVTPSLRRSWLAGVLLVLAAVVGAAYLLAPGPRNTPLIGAGGQLGAGGLPASLIPFLVLAPILPLAAVAAAFSAQLDPAHDLATAAPVSGLWLLWVRSVAVIGATLLPTMLAALLLPGPWWLAFAVLLPALAVSAGALAVGTVTGPVPAAVGASFAWVAAVVATGAAAGHPALVFGPAGQVAALAVLIGAVAVVAARRRHIDFGWTEVRS